jgi:isoquinoline 1-oxidoreductase subunit beta
VSAGALTRREFIKVTGGAGAGLVLAVSLPGRGLGEEAAPAAPFTPNVWVEIAPDGAVTLTVAKSEMGQGARTGLAMILADELEADWERVTLRQADADPRYGDMGTGGSSSIREGWEPLRRAGAAAREMLRQAAAGRWGVAAAECRAEGGEVVHAGSGRRLGYGELAAAAAKLPVPESPPLKDPADFRYVGRPLARYDTPAIVRGEAVYGLDVRLDGMLHAAVARCPVFGGGLAGFDAAAARQVPGVVEVVKLDGVGARVFSAPGVAVVAESTWAALEGRRALQVRWAPGPGADASSESLLAACRAAVAAPAEMVSEDGDARSSLAAADEGRRVVAEYQLPFLAHATMEPMNCTAQVAGGRCEVWAPTQFPQWAQQAVAEALGLPPDKVTVHVTLLGGGFGRRINPDYAVEAAQVAAAVARPVQVVWSREDDLQHDFYRPLSVHRLEAVLDPSGRPAAWLYRIAGTAIRAFYGGADTKEPWAQELTGVQVFPYRVPRFRVEYAAVDSLVPRGWWRSVSSSQNAFVRESFIDELAAKAGQDPYAYRLALLGEPRKLPLPGDRGFVLDTGRLAGVLRLAAEKAGWGKPLPAGRGRGIAAFFDHLSYAAEVAEVSVSGGELRVERVVAAIDCGTVVNPALVERQVEGGIIDGLSPLFGAEITLAAGRIEQSNFDDYPLLTMRQAPAIEVHLAPSAEPPTGAGEPGLPPIAPAVANALAALTGKRVRHLPIRPADLA